MHIINKLLYLKVSMSSNEKKYHPLVIYMVYYTEDYRINLYSTYDNNIETYLILNKQEKCVVDNNIKNSSLKFKIRLSPVKMIHSHIKDNNIESKYENKLLTFNNNNNIYKILLFYEKIIFTDDYENNKYYIMPHFNNLSTEYDQKYNTLILKCDVTDNIYSICENNVD